MTSSLTLRLTYSSSPPVLLSRPLVSRLLCLSSLYLLLSYYLVPSTLCALLAHESSSLVPPHRSAFALTLALSRSINHFLFPLYLLSPFC
ncbi:hypothetical protein EDB92DRAFT_1873884 [Lactarius akahatsu]|uniref:Uncharacterized protein n=1 Tax=Lactarius akahatsu TaxID=416441 RepID=A0AAD4LDX6_9AGAM|nr:hypothetical protein EDB92DRAFT_1873884 [Lactarius akahatsu]